MLLFPLTLPPTPPPTPLPTPLPMLPLPLPLPLPHPLLLLLPPPSLWFAMPVCTPLEMSASTVLRELSLLEVRMPVLPVPRDRLARVEPRLPPSVSLPGPVLGVMPTCVIERPGVLSDARVTTAGLSVTVPAPDLT